MYHQAEQRCKRFGCQYNACMQREGPTAKCKKLIYDFNDCVSLELSSLTQKYQETGTLPHMSAIKKPDNLRDAYSNGDWRGSQHECVQRNFPLKKPTLEVGFSS